jgi:nucleoside-diphosphate-sugar epimerase
MRETHVVFGACGALGSAIVRALVADGEPVRSVVDDEEEAKEILPPGTAVVYGDATDPDGARRACRGATIIYHCVNVAHIQWLQLMPQMHETIIDAARESRALVVFPGNVMGYGPFQQLPANEEHPLAAETRKGRLRNAMEQRLMQVHEAGEISAVIPRFPDLYGPNVTNPQMAPLFRSALSGKTGTWPGKLDVPHDLLYVDDAARACLLLASTPTTRGQVWHVPGPGPLTGRQFIEMVFEAGGNRPKTRALGRTLFRFFGALIPNAGEMAEILYLYEQPMVLDGSKFASAFPSFSYTPHREAIRRTVEWFSEYYPPEE